MSIRVGGLSIGRNYPPFIIAEMSGNHNQSLERALEIVEAAAATGAHALKLQTYTADTMTLDLAEGEFFIDDPNSLWNGRTLYDLYQIAMANLHKFSGSVLEIVNIDLIAFAVIGNQTNAQHTS